MKVILLKDIPKLGRKRDVKEVSVGFARNYLFRRGLAKPATEGALTEHEARVKRDTARAEKELTEAQDTVARIDGMEVVIPVRVTEKGSTYSSVTAQSIIKALEANGIKISARQVQLERPIEMVGEHIVPLMFSEGLEAELKVTVVPEKKD
jgi:large subunit ribosomal protein L9